MNKKEGAALSLIGSIKAYARIDMAEDLLKTVYDHWKDNIIDPNEMETMEDLFVLFRARTMKFVKDSEEILGRDE